MALMNCPECNKQISDKASNCPYCGYPLALLYSKENDKIIESTEIESNNDGTVSTVTSTTDTPTENEIPVSGYKKGIKNFLGKQITLFNKKMPMIILPVAVFVIVAVILTVVLIPKGLNTSKKNTSNKTTYSQSSTTKLTTKPTPATTYVVPTFAPTVKYLTDRSVQFNEQDDDYVLLFGLKDEKEEYVSSKGTVSVTITDTTGNELYNKDISFYDSDFSSWSSKLNPTARYLCGIHIMASEISGSASSSGTLSFSVELDDGVSFDSSNLNITNLKQKDIDIQLPALPQSIINYNYSNEVEDVVEVTDIEIETKVFYDGSASIQVHLTVGMLENNSTSTSHYSHVGYKLKDSNGVIVDSGNAFINPMAVGETSKDTFYISNLDANESYVLELDNSKG